MTEQNTADAKTGSENSTDTEASKRADGAMKLTIGLAGLAVILVAGIVFSVIVFFRDDAEPLVALDQATDQSVVESGEFEPDPVLDKANRVIYVPLDENGVILSRSTAQGGSRPEDQAPSGVMLQRIHGNMDMPFSTSDGPTDFTDTGIATGFARTAQGAGLAAAHYLGYMSAGADRTQMLVDSGLVSDPAGEVPKKWMIVPGSIPAVAMPIVRVTFNPDLTLVEFGRQVEKTSEGTSHIQLLKVQMVWRSGTGWVLKVDPSSTSLHTEPMGSPGWSQWW